MSVLNAIRDLIQQDIGGRGLATDPAENLLTLTAGDFTSACRSIAGSPRQPSLAVVTGFWIPHGTPPAGETDGPLGALFLARALAPLGFRVVLATDAFCLKALEAGLRACGLEKQVHLVELPPAAEGTDAMAYWSAFANVAGTPTHLVALERVGPSHLPDSLRTQPATTPDDLLQFLSEIPVEHHDRCHTMRGLDITSQMRPAHLLFEAARRVRPSLRTIAIGDGGNEIGMGKLPWRALRRNIPNGGLVACRVPADDLIVCGVSNWGAYALAAGVLHLLGIDDDPTLFAVEHERELLRVMVEEGPLVDGMTGQPSVSVDGLDFERYAEPLRQLPAILSGP
ncbi:MAG: DUF4392 domain-containing protein [Planctomycetes bacterium]|nr:DUF4392 domain-containing protein [Planctomycetota bacterium]